ncbi:thioester reductase domain-containing protein [Methylobacter sp.]|uniref:thioester reductase domain-containing protein n=1 Tax=Methylobacter sp. TaxID=2051955 RepID=UPI002FDD489B
MPIIQAPSLADVLIQRAQLQPDRLSHVFMDHIDADQHPLTYGDIDRRARAIAARLQAIDARRVLLVYPHGPSFFLAFMACWYAGITPIPVFPPQSRRGMARIDAILRDCAATHVLSSSDLMAKVVPWFQEEGIAAGLEWLDTDSVPDSEAVDWRSHRIDPAQPAFLQYTSGSTGKPKGVVVSHANLIANEAMLNRCFNHNEETRIFSWLPFYHDMGLIGPLFNALYVGVCSYYIPPQAFIRDPMQWLRGISKFRASTTGGPNFAYDLCARKATPENCSELDLSCLQVAFNGAEPIRADTLRRFQQTFAPYGFSPSAWLPCYGMAEATLFISGRRSAPVFKQHEGKTHVSSGKSWGDCEVLAVDPNTRRPVPDGVTGELWLTGSHVAQGYWNQPEQTALYFQAQLEHGGAPYLRTGDLGFMDQGEIYVTGRLKDLIILRGRNLYPQDLELAAQNAHSALRLDGGGAFAREAEDGEALVLVQEVERSQMRGLDVAQVFAAIREAYWDAFQVQADELVLVKPGSVPKTTSGKVRRSACQEALAAGELPVIARSRRETPIEPPVATTVAVSHDAATVQKWLRHYLAQKTGGSAHAIDVNTPFAAYGLDSLAAVELSEQLGLWLGKELDNSLAFDYPTPARMAEFVAAAPQTGRATTITSGDKDDAIAIVGLGCRFPGADGPDAYWELLSQGLSAIREVPEGRWPVSGTRERWGGFLENIDRFDAAFFGISPKEAMRMDPQQRLLLEVAWETLEHAGFSADNLRGSSTGVFVGISSTDYSLAQLAAYDDLNAYSATGNALCIAANRLSYVFDWRGPSHAVDSACSSSLVALHQACQSIRTGDCDLALAGGVNMLLIPHWSKVFAEANMLAEDGLCKTFDAAADGYVRGEGCGLVLLKRLSDARRDGDNVLAVIHGSAVNQDGRSNGLTAPNGPAQEAVIRMALNQAGIEPGQVAYVEAHGTGTVLGDPIEFQALQRVYDQPATPPCALASVKTNIGHLEAAAGIAGLIKAVLSLHHGGIPPHRNFKRLNPSINLDSSRFFIPDRLTRWPDSGQSYAAVSSFGFGGTNAHVVVGVGDPKLSDDAKVSPRDSVVLPLTATNPAELKKLAGRHADYLRSHAEIDLVRYAYTAATGRAKFAERGAVLGHNRQEFIIALDALAAGETTPQVQAGRSPSQPPPVVFLFTGQGSEYLGMGQSLYRQQPVFRQTWEACRKIIIELSGDDLLAEAWEADEDKLRQARTTQPALFALQVSLFRVWTHWGVRPDYVIGHSLGELAAACAAGIFSLEDGMKLALERGRLCQQLAADGAMAAVYCHWERIYRELGEDAQALSLAAINRPDLVTVSGRADKVAPLLDRLEAADIRVSRLSTRYAYHSEALDSVLQPFTAIVDSLHLDSPTIAMLTSCRHGMGSPDQPDYWVAQLRHTVDFAGALAELPKEQPLVFVEIGATPHLLPLARSIAGNRAPTLAASLRPGRDDGECIAEALGALHCAGVLILWEQVYPGVKLLPGLPSYPFDHSQSYWYPAKSYPANVGCTVRALAPEAHAAGPTADLLPEAGDALHYRIDWEPVDISLEYQSSAAPVGRAVRAFSASEQQADDSFWWLIPGDLALAKALARQLRAGGEEVQVSDEKPKTVDRPLSVVWIENDGGEPSLVRLAELVRDLEKDWVAGTRLSLISRCAQQVKALNDAVRPGHALLWGMMRSLAVECPSLAGGIYDLPASGDADQEANWLTVALLQNKEDQLAWRDGASYAPRIVAESANWTAQRYKADPQGAYLITGGLGSLGRRTVRYLVERGAGHVVVTTRQAEPEQIDWPTSAAIESVTCNLDDAEALASLIGSFGVTRPPLRGVIHTAGTVSLLPVGELTAENMQPVLAPKLAVEQLGLAVSGQPLDFFICYSSIAAAWGSVALAHYAAANHYLDAFAALRRHNNLPVTSIAWGPWAGGGMAEEQHRERLVQSGITAISDTAGFACLDRVLLERPVYRICAQVDWARLRSLLESRRVRPLLNRLPGTYTVIDPVAESPAVVRNWRRDELDGLLRLELAQIMELSDPAAFDAELGFNEQGMDSLMAVDFKNRLTKALGLPLADTLAFDHPNLRCLEDYLWQLIQGNRPQKAAVKTATSTASPIAIVGMACRFPGGADSPEQFWELLSNGVDAIGPMPTERWRLDDWWSADPNELGKFYTREGGFITGVDRFDHEFFRLSPREAALLDPQQRLALEVAWEALERAGENASALRDSNTGVFVGIGSQDYQQLLLDGAPPESIEIYTGTGNTMAFAAGRIAHLLGVRGPAMAVDTACSSSLVAVHLARQALEKGEADCAVAVGVSLMLSPLAQVYLSRARALAPDGRCKSFDAYADGYGRGEGSGALVLKRLDDALRDGNPVLAVLAGSAVNHDGASSGLTVPNQQAQTELLRAALSNAGLPASSIGYLEAHGTGTALGDPIEIHAVQEVFGDNRSADNPLYLGTVKSNIGHLEAAAGMAGLIKAVLAVGKGRLPASLHFRRWNPHIRRDATPLEVVKRLQDWDSNELRNAGVSGFGLSGTNAHIIVQQYVEDTDYQAKEAWTLPLLKLSAHSAGALQSLARRYAELFAENPDSATICAAANSTRGDWNFRLAVPANDSATLSKALSAYADGTVPNDLHLGQAGGKPPRVAFYFSGQALLPTELDMRDIPEAFALHLKACAALLDDSSEYDCWKSLQNDGTAFAQFAFQYSLSALWMDWGIDPVLICGDGAGLLAGACATGAISPASGGSLARLLASGDIAKFSEAWQRCTWNATKIPLHYAAGTEIIAKPAFEVFCSGSGLPLKPDCQWLLHFAYEAIPAEAETCQHLAALPVGENIGKALADTLARLYVSGANPDWPSICGHHKQAAPLLPTYPFQRSRHWAAPAPAVGKASSRKSQGAELLLGRHVRSPLLPEQWFELELDARSLPHIGDHRLFESVVVAAATYVAMAAHIGRRLFPGNTVVLENVRLLRALTLADDESRTLQFMLRPAQEGQFAFEVVSLENDAHHEHAKGLLSSIAPVVSADTLDLSGVQSRCGEQMTGNDFYDGFWQLGYHLGPIYRWIDTVWSGSGEVLSRLCPHPESLGENESGHPGLIDSCFQTLTRCIPEEYKALLSGASLFIPVAIDRVYFYSGLETVHWCHAVLLESQERDLLTANLRLFDAQGRLAGEISGFSVKAVPRHRLVGANLAAPVNYGLMWQRLDPPQPEPANLSWCLVGEEAERNAIAGALENVGQSCKAFSWYDRIPEHDAEVLVLCCTKLIFAPQSNSPAPRHSAFESPLEHLLRQLRDAISSPSLKAVWLVTRGAQPVDRHAINGLDSGLFSGIHAVLSNEYANLFVGIVDLDLDNDVGDYKELARWLSQFRENRLAIRNGAAFACRLQPWKPASAGERCQALDSRSRGVLDALVWEEAVRGELAADEVEIRVVSSALNFRDVLQALAMYPGEATALGGECAGQVVRVGANVRTVAVGDPVFCLLAEEGCLRDFVRTSDDRVFKLPPELSFDEAAGMPVAFLTAYHGLRVLAGLRSGEWVLIHAGTGGVGMAAIQIANSVGAHIIATAGSEEKREYLRSLGIVHVGDSRSTAFADTVRVATGGRGVDVVLNALAGDMITASMDALAPNGRFVEVGKADIWDEERLSLNYPGISYHHFDLVELQRSRPAAIADGIAAILGDLAAGRLHPLPYRLFSRADTADAFRYMAQARHRGKVLLRLSSPQNPAFNVRADATYLVTGGLGGLGRFFAYWLASQGAGAVLLTGRRPLDNEGATFLAELEALGCKSAYVAVDVSDFEALAQALDRHKSLPLRGIIHAAGVADDAPLHHLDWPHFANVLASKVSGAWNLHRLSAGLPLDFFALCSSASGWLGNPGQANYAAANTWLDSFAAWRRMHGLPALSIAWGPWAEAGMHARLVAGRNQDGNDMGTIAPEQGIAALAALLESRDVPAALAVLPSRAENYLRQAAPSALRPLLAEQLRSIGNHQAPVRQRLDEDFSRLPDAERYPFLLDYLRRQLGQSLSLPAAEVSTDASLELLGLDSLMSVEVVNRIERDFGLRLSADFLTRSSSPQELAAGLMSRLQQQSQPIVEEAVLKLADDVKLPENWCPADEIADCWPPRHILFTGATGYLGAYLLAELLERTDCEIYCLVRAENTDAAFERLRANAGYYGLSTALPIERIRLLVGDIAQPLMGLDEAVYRQLTLEVDAVLSAGAHVDFTLPYSDLRASNVSGTIEMLRFAAAGRRKPLHFVSTLGLLMSKARSDNDPALESWPPDCEGESLVNGYEQSKWVAEHILKLAEDSGMPIAVYRPGLLTGDSSSGRFVNTDQFVARFLKSSIQLGCIPALENGVEMLPVDFAAQVIVAGLQSASSLGKAFHIRHPEPLVIAEVVEVLRAKGYAMDIVPYAEWQQRVLAGTDDDSGNALIPFRNMISGMDQRHAEFPPVDDSNCREICAQAGIGFHSSAELLESYLLYFENSGFL